jgi:hypothetical protein
LVDRNHLLGFHIPFQLPLTETYTDSKIDYLWLATPLSVKITATTPNATPLWLLTVCVANPEGTEILQLQGLTLNYGDVVEIDSYEQVAYLTPVGWEKINITGLVQLNSVWPVLSGDGESTVAVDCEVAEEALEVERTWRDVF